MDDLPLTVAGLTKAYHGRLVLNALHFSVRAGDAVAVVGPNGSGKSTLIGCITGDRLPDRGEVRICGADPFSDPRTSAGCMGFVPEQPFLYGELTGGEMIEFVAAARGLSREEREAERLLELLGLSGTEGILCRELSQGMGRKLALLCALLHEPRIIVLDEALNGLDQPSVARLVDELDARRSMGAAVLISSHDLSFLAGWCEAGLLLAPGGEWTWLSGDEWERWRTAPLLGASVTREGTRRR